MDMNQPLLTNKPMLNVTATPPTVLIYIDFVGL